MDTLKLGPIRDSNKDEEDFFAIESNSVMSGIGISGIGKKEDRKKGALCRAPFQLLEEELGSFLAVFDGFLGKLNELLELLRIGSG